MLKQKKVILEKGDNWFELPSDFKKAMKVCYNDLDMENPNRALMQISLTEAQNVENKECIGIPSAFYIKDKKVFIWPYTSDVSIIKFIYQ